jgi:UTP--glucose-1-phosphate uridylyltransferase
MLAMPRVRKAVITAGGMGTRHFPATRALQKELMPLVDRDGLMKPTLLIIMEEAWQSGVEEFCIVVSPCRERCFRELFRPPTREEAAWLRGRRWAGEAMARLCAIGERTTLVVQDSPEGYGHAVYQARRFVGEEPFLLLLGDHLCLSRTPVPCSRQVMEAHSRSGAAVSGVCRKPEERLQLYGTVGADALAGSPGLFEVRSLVEKPSVQLAREALRTPGLAAGEYFCFFGSHVLPRSLFELLEHLVRNDVRERGEIQLTGALKLLGDQERYLALEIEGDAYDMGIPECYLETQIALAARSPFRDRLFPSLRGLSTEPTLAHHAA